MKIDLGVFENEKFKNILQKSKFIKILYDVIMIDL